MALDRGIKTEDETETNRCLDLAVTCFGKLEELVPASPDSYRGLAIAFLRQKKQEEALAAIERGMKVIPKDADLMVVKGSLLLEQNKDAEAKELLEKAIEIDPEHPQAHLLLTEAQLGASDD